MINKTSGDSKNFGCDDTRTLSLQEISPKDYAELQSLRAELQKVRAELESLGILSQEINELKAFVDQLLRLPLEELEIPEIAGLYDDLSKLKSEIALVVSADKKVKSDAVAHAASVIDEMSKIGEKLQAEIAAPPKLPPPKAISTADSWKTVQVSETGATITLPDFDAYIAVLSKKLRDLSADGNVDGVAAEIEAASRFVQEWGMKIADLKIVAPSIASDYDAFVNAFLSVRSDIFIDSKSFHPVLRKTWLQSSEQLYLLEASRQLSYSDALTLTRALNQIPENIPATQKRVISNGLGTIFFWLIIKAHVPDSIDNVQKIEHSVVRSFSRTLFKIARGAADWVPIASDFVSLCSCMTATKCDGADQSIGPMVRALSCADSMILGANISGVVKVKTGLTQFGEIGKSIEGAVGKISSAKTNSLSAYILEKVSKPVANKIVDTSLLKIAEFPAERSDAMMLEVPERARNSAMLYLLIGPDSSDVAFSKRIVDLNKNRRKAGFTIDPNSGAFTWDLYDVAFGGTGLSLPTTTLDARLRTRLQTHIQKRLRDDEVLLVLDEQSGQRRKIFFDVSSLIYYCFDVNYTFTGTAALKPGAPGRETELCRIP